MGQFFYVITLDQHVIHRRTRVINLESQLSRSLEPTTYHPQEDRMGLISAVLMSGMEVKLIKPPQLSHTCGTSKPCQSAQTSELVSMRNC